MEFHPVANIFPMMTGDDYRALVSDIKQNGLIEPITVYQGQILDGRNRYAACLELGIEPKYREWDNGSDPLAFVVSLNLMRRHLTKEQQAEVMREMRAHGATYQDIAQATGVGVATAWRNTHDVNFQMEIENERGQSRPPAYTPRQTTEFLNNPATWTHDYRPPEERTISWPEQPKTIDNPALYSSDSEEWYTPLPIIERTVKLMGMIDLDPCSNPGTPRIPAAAHFTQQDDGLTQTWSGRVYMNPPYGREIVKWVECLCQQYENGSVTEAIALVPSRTDTAWFLRMRDYLKCFITGRLSFSDNESAAPFPSVAIYLGDNKRGFIDAFSDIGDVYERCSQL